jgi:hypothetical protein
MLSRLLSMDNIFFYKNNYSKLSKTFGETKHDNFRLKSGSNRSWKWISKFTAPVRNQCVNDSGHGVRASHCQTGLSLRLQQPTSAAGLQRSVSLKVCRPQPALPLDAGILARSAHLHRLARCGGAAAHRVFPSARDCTSWTSHVTSPATSTPPPKRAGDNWKQGAARVPDQVQSGRCDEMASCTFGEREHEAVRLALNQTFFLGNKRFLFIQ